MTTATERLSRILTLIPYVQSNQGIDVEEVAAYARCTPHEVFEDLIRVMMCGVPPYMPDDYIGVYLEAGRVYLRFADHFKRPVCLTLLETVTLRLMLATFAADDGSPHGRCLKSIVEKIDAILSTEARNELAAVSANIRADSPASGVTNKLRLLQRALNESVKVNINYYTLGRGELASRVVRPYALIDHMGQWYLVAFCETRSAERIFRVDRIRDMALLIQERYEIPGDFDVEEYRGNRMFKGFTSYTLRVRFGQFMARWILERYAGERMEVQADGAVILSIGADAYDWAVLWLLKYGDHAEAVEPAEVRERMAEALDKILLRYKVPASILSPSTL